MILVCGDAHLADLKSEKQRAKAYQNMQVWHAIPDLCNIAARSQPHNTATICKVLLSL
jgi:hypothetical protein